MRILRRLHDYFFPHRRNSYRPHLFSTASVAALALAVVILEAGFLLQTKFVFLKTDFLASVLPGTLVALTNQDRAAHGLAGVVENPALSAAAQAAAQDMAERGYFSHESPEGEAPWRWIDEAGYRYSYAGQNLAVNFTDSRNVESAWMESPTHRANIIKPEFTHVGFGVANGIYENKETTFVVEFFASPAAAPASAESVEVRLPQEQAGTSLALSASSSAVLGTQTEADPSSPSFFARILASPLNTLITLLAVLFVIISISFATAVLMRGREQHPAIIIGGALLIAVVSGAMLISSLLAGGVRLDPVGQTASADSANRD